MLCDAMKNDRNLYVHEKGLDENICRCTLVLEESASVELSENLPSSRPNRANTINRMSPDRGEYHCQLPVENRVHQGSGDIGWRCFTDRLHQPQDQRHDIDARQMSRFLNGV